jgi:hypothetical protein
LTVPFLSHSLQQCNGKQDLCQFHSSPIPYSNAMQCLVLLLIKDRLPFCAPEGGFLSL